MFIDIHCHVLPGLDDGADSVDETCDIIRQAYAGGTNVMLATPHYLNKRQCSKNNSKENIFRTFQLIKNELVYRNIPLKLLLGSETLVNSEIDNYFREGLLIPINGTKYILVEFDFDIVPEYFFCCIDKIISCGLLPVIAHPERYDFLQSDYSYFSSIASRGCLLQINKGSPLGLYGDEAEKLSVWLMKNNFADVIASDCHNNSSRNGDFEDIYSWLIGRFSEKYIMKLLHDNPKAILLGSKVIQGNRL